MPALFLCDRKLQSVREPLIPGSVIKTQHSEYLAQNLYVSVEDNGIHSVIFGLKADIAFFFVEGFDCGGILHKSHHDISVGGSGLLSYQHLVTVKDAGIYHAFALDTKKKALLVGHIFCREGEVILYVLHRQNGLPCSDCADEGDVYHFAAHQIKVIVNNLDGAGLGRIAADVAVLLQGFQMLTASQISRTAGGNPRFRISFLM